MFSQQSIFRDALTILQTMESPPSLKARIENSSLPRQSGQTSGHPTNLLCYVTLSVNQYWTKTCRPLSINSTIKLSMQIPNHHTYLQDQLWAPPAPSK